MKLRDLLFENPDVVQVKGVSVNTWGDEDYISFLEGDNGNIYVSEFNKDHHQLIYSKYNSCRNYKCELDINGRIWPYSKVISFWVSPDPSSMNIFLTKINKSLKKQKIHIDPKLWKMDVTVPIKIGHEFVESHEVEELITLQEYIDRSYLYPWIKPDYVKPNYKLT